MRLFCRRRLLEFFGCGRFWFVLGSAVIGQFRPWGLASGRFLAPSGRFAFKRLFSIQLSCWPQCSFLKVVLPGYLWISMLAGRPKHSTLEIACWAAWGIPLGALVWSDCHWR